MLGYENKEELKEQIEKYGGLFIKEFISVKEEDKDSLVEGVDRTPVQMIAYQLGWMNLILSWEEEEERGMVVITPHKDYKWNNLGGLYESFYKVYESYSLEELCNLFEERKKKIIELLDSYTDYELFQPGGRRWAASTPANWPLWKWIHINTVAPFKSFRSKIRKWKKLK